MDLFTDVSLLVLAACGGAAAFVLLLGRRQDAPEEETERTEPTYRDLFDENRLGIVALVFGFLLVVFYDRLGEPLLGAGPPLGLSGHLVVLLYGACAVLFLVCPVRNCISAWATIRFRMTVLPVYLLVTLISIVHAYMP